MIKGSHMPQHHNWFQPVRLGSPERRKRDKERKRHFSGCTNERNPPPLATYRTINKAQCHIQNIGGHIIKTYDLNAIAVIYGLTTRTVYRWYKSGMLPEPAFVEQGSGYTSPIYLRSQILVICHVLNDIFEQGVTQYRMDHHAHREMLFRGCLIAIEGYTRKLSKEPKKKLPILPHPREWQRLKQLRKQNIILQPYRQTIEELLLSA
jgi:hypothetical protein